MATKNKNVLYSIDELKSSFNAFLSDPARYTSEKTQLDIALNEIKSLEAEIRSLDNDIKYSQSITSGKSTEEIHLLIEKYKNAVYLLNAIINNYSRYLELEKKSKTRVLSEEEQKELICVRDQHDSFMNENLSLIHELLQEFSETKISELTKKINAKIEKLKSEASHATIALDHTRKRAEAHGRTTTLKAKQNELQRKISTITAPSYENFKLFLSSKGISLVYAEDLYDYLTKKTSTLTFDKKQFKMRREHDKLNFAIKKVVIPLAITTTAIAVAYTDVMNSGMVGGSEYLGFIPVSGTPGLTNAALSSSFAVMGAAATVGVIGGKNLITRTYFRVLEKNLDAYRKSSLEGTPSAKLLKTISKKQDIILESDKATRFVMEIFNRNRVHEIQALTIELAKLYNRIENYSDETVEDLFNGYKKIVETNPSKSVKDRKVKTMLTDHNFSELVELCPIDIGKFLEEHEDCTLEEIVTQFKTEATFPIYELLANIETFILEDMTKSKIKELTTAKKATEKHLIENVDIYAKIKIAYDSVMEIAPDRSNEKFLLRYAKSKIKDTEAVKDLAYEMLMTEPHFLTSALKLHAHSVEEEVHLIAPAGPRFEPVERTVVDQVVDEVKSTLTLTLDNGKKVTMDTKDILPGTISTIRSAKNKYIITYEDGTILEVAKIKKVQKEIVAALELISDLLEQDEYIEKIKNQGFNNSTIKALKRKLTEWEADKTSGFSTSGKVKELYSYCLDTFGDLVDDDSYSV